MKLYPSISASTGQSFREFDAYVFDKIDGSNLRFEWSRKRGWYKFGTRHRLFDHTDEVFGGAVETFNKTLSDPIASVAKKKGWDSCVAFAEFWGSNSFAGEHLINDHKILTLFDVAVHKVGLLGPREYLDLFGDLASSGVHYMTAKFLGKHKWTRGFVEQVRLDQIPGITFEGVVGKTMDGRRLIMAKAKTQVWLDKVKEKFGANAEKVLNS